MGGRFEHDDDGDSSGYGTESLNAAKLFHDKDKLSLETTSELLETIIRIILLHIGATVVSVSVCLGTLSLAEHSD